jgi:hypothetical protein
MPTDRPRTQALLSATAALRRHRHLGALCAYAVVIGAIYASVLDGTRSLITNGQWSQPLYVMDPLAGGPATAPLTRLVAAAWLHLQLPVVDPFQGYGIPLLTNQGVPVYLPQILFHLVLPTDYSIWNVVNLIGLAFGVYLLASSFGQRFFGAMAAGTLASLAGAAPPNVNMSMLNPLAVLPFALLAVRYAVDPDSEHRPAALLGLATALAFLCLSGFQEVLPLMAVAIVVYTVALIVHFGTWRRRPALIVGAVSSAALGGAVGSIGILPSLSILESGTTVNGPGSYLPHLPSYWLSTLTLPTITDRALNQAPQDLGNAVFTLGTPLLVLVVVLALAIALRRGGGGIRWYVLPSVAFVVYGVLGYADIGHVLQLFDLPVFDAIQTRRFLQFGWWIPLCLLLGAVVSNARSVRWKDALLALLAAAGFDAYFFVRYRQAAAAQRVAGDTAGILHAPIVAAVVIVVFLGAALASRRFGPAPAGLAMALVVLASCAYDLPTNFPASSYDAAVTSVDVPGMAGQHGTELAYFGSRQLPTEQYSFQIYGPIIPTAYADALTALFSVPQAGGRDPIAASLPTLAQLTLTPRAVTVLRSFGVDLLVVPQPLSATDFPGLPSCGSSPVAAAGSPVCFLGETANAHPGVAYAPAENYAYRILGANSLVQRVVRPTPVASTGAALAAFTRQLSTSSAALGRDAYVTTTSARLRATRGVRGMSRRATTETVSITLRSRSTGLVVLRESYQPGVRVRVNGRPVSASPVDGGLWTAVDVGRGVSHVVLDYTTKADLVEFGIAVAGLSALFLAWLGLGAWELRLRLRRWPGAHGAEVPVPESPPERPRSGPVTRPAPSPERPVSN